MGVIAEWRKEDYENGKKEGIKEGIEEASIYVARNMLLKKYSIEEIMEITKLNRQTILDLQ